MYEDYTTDADGGLADNSEDDKIPVMDTELYRQFPTPEVNANYVNSLVIFPRGNNYARGNVIEQKRDASGNAFIRMNKNPILDTRKYRVEFYDEEVSEIMVNVIEESMYDACDD